MSATPMRTSRRGSSVSTVPDPTSTASTLARQRCTAARAAGPVIQRWPSVGTSAPSAVWASFSVTCGRPTVTTLRKPSNCSAIAATIGSSPGPGPTTSRPRAASTCAPPLATGLGSAWPITTRATPAATSASVHGGVRPWWAQGSSVTTAVAPRAEGPAARSATTSACAPPAGSVAPAPTTSPSRSSTHPTAGLGEVVARTCSASAVARTSAARSHGDAKVTAIRRSVGPASQSTHRTDGTRRDRRDPTGPTGPDRTRPDPTGPDRTRRADRRGPRCLPTAPDRTRPEDTEPRRGGGERPCRRGAEPRPRGRRRPASSPHARVRRLPRAARTTGCRPTRGRRGRQGRSTSRSSPSVPS
jgi:hypothetical protein